MTTVVGALQAVLGIDTVAFEQGLDRAAKQASRIGRRLESVGAGLQSFGTQMSAAVTLPLTALGVTAYQAAQQAEQAAASVRASLASMGDGAGRSFGELAAQAERLMSTSLFDDDDILQKVTANLLTFGNVAGEQFDRAQQAAVDLSTKLGTDLQGSAMMLGKALNDPVRGMTALTRAGVSFTEAQRAQIEAMVAAGDLASAQNLILAELERQVGGSAQAARDAAGAQADFNQKWSEFQETIGAVIAEVLPPLLNALTNLMNGFMALSPEMQNFVLIGGGIAAAIGPVAAIVGAITSAVAAMTPVIAAAGPIIVAVFTGPAAPFILIGAAVTAVVAAIWHFRDEIAAVFRAAGEAVQQFYAEVVTWLRDRLSAVIDGVIGRVRAVGDAFGKLYRDVVGNSWVPDMVRGIRDWFGRLDAAMTAPATAAAQRVGSEFERLEARVRGSVEGIAGAIRSKDWGGLARQIGDVMVQIGGGIGGRAGGSISKIGTILSALGGGNIGTILGTIGGGKIGKVLGTIGSIFRRLPGFADGGSFEVGGRAGIDTNLVAFRATAGEQVTITPRGGSGGAGASLVYAPTIDARGADAAVVARLEAQQRALLENFSAMVRDSVGDLRARRRL